MDGASARRARFAFALVGVPLATGGLPLTLYLAPYYASLGLDLATIGVIVTLTRLTDILTDPVVGAWSDRTSARRGRRAPWLLAGVPVMAIATLAVFTPWLTPGPAQLFWSVAALYFGWTLIGIPLAAWAAELAPDYHERSRLLGARTWGGVIGALVAILAPLVMHGLASQGVTAAAPTAPGSLQPMLGVLAWLTVALLVVTVPWLVWTVPQVPVMPPRGSLPFGEGLRLVAANGAFRRLLAASMLSAIGWNGINALFIFFVTAYLGAAQNEWPLIVLAYTLAQVIGTPLLIRLAPRFSKHRLLAAASLLSIALFSLVLLLERGDYLLYAAISFGTGLLAPAINILGPSMAGDVIDADTLASGRQRGAFFMALWGMADKLAVALAMLVALPLVQSMGFDPAAPSAAGLVALKYAFCLVPCAFFLASVACLKGYPLTAARHAEIRAALEPGA